MSGTSGVQAAHGVKAVHGVQAVTDLTSTSVTAVPAAKAPAAPAKAPAAPDTGARTEAAAGVITDARARIDDLDGRIIGLVQERMAVSAVIQRERIGSGGRRVNLSREMQILEHYRGQLGRPGTALAMTLLELCRGRI
ncbi:chorismate mutase [Streptomyces albofaciens JCM 4342]|uniref:chorismate mutase n=1 Tax=Streptomyces albofaciens TaxID=66866 RepID=UPI00123A0B87|nr:chorismate mutase [Streptomyces albofaciens]KAA6214489.1 chorismate mutase [Streptomyces albofaciens JCM 4342]